MLSQEKLAALYMEKKKITNSVTDRSLEISYFTVHFALKKNFRKKGSVAENQKEHFLYASFKIPAEFLQ